MAIISFDQFLKQSGGTAKDVKTVTPQVPPQESGYLSRVGGELKGAFAGLQKTTERGAELMQEGKPIQGVVMSGLGTAGGFIRGAFSPLTAAIAPIIQKGLESSGVLENEAVQQKIASLDEWAKAHPDAAENLKNIVEIGGTLIGSKGVTELKPIIERGGKTIIEGGEKALKGVSDTTGMIGGGIARIPSKIATNVAEKQAVEASIKTLPTKIAQTAVRDGIDIIDVKDVYKIPLKVKPQAKELVNTVIKFAKRETDIDPIEMVGKPIVAKLKKFDSLRGKIGQKLGVVAEKLGNTTSQELTPAILGQIRKVPGLLGILINKKGVLDFSNTTLNLAENATDRKAIQSIFSQAVKNGSGMSKHKMRQSLFEILGGKKKSLANITDTQEKAFDAVRKGLSDVLETKNATYKSLSAQYRSVIQPLKDMRKMMRSLPEATEDILDMSAGLLARRLTSTSLSQGQVKVILRNLDKATKIKGNLLETTENLQKLYNILGRYYDIAPKTGFQGQVKAGLESVGGVGEAVIGAVRSVAGETVAVRQKALENILREVLK